MEKPKDDMHEVAAAFLRSPRGMYIVGQALAVAIETMGKVPKPYTEVSNIEDMQFLMDNLFPLGHLSTEVFRMHVAETMARGERDAH